MRLSKTIIIAVLIILPIMSSHLAAQSKKDYSGKEFRVVENTAFGFSETLQYDVGYGSMIAGQGYVKVNSKPTKVYGRDCYEVLFGVKSSNLISKLYYIHDQYKSYVDCKGIFSWQFKQKIHEQKYKKNFWATFDQYTHKAYTKDTTVSIPPYEHDVISAFMYVRTMNLRSMPDGTVFALNNFWKDSSYKLMVNVIKRETIKVPAGKFKCIVIEPTIEGGDLFTHDEKIWVWLTDDDRKIPVKVGTKLFFGYVGAELTKYSGVRGKIDAKLD